MVNASALDRSRVLADVQRNCHISDAIHARNYSLCIYLLKMREFFRWEQGYDFGAPLPKGPLGEWLMAREQLWETLEEAEFAPLLLEAQPPLDPFDNNAINAILRDAGLVYSGGLCGPKPHFFLAELDEYREEQGCRIYIAGRELARELTAPPALSLNGVIYLRRESLCRMIWEKLEEWGWQDQERAIARAVAHYGFRYDLNNALSRMSNDELDTLLQHELGEVAVGTELGVEWEEMLAMLPRSRVEFQLRAIRDHLVDCRYTLPWLLQEGREAGLHFFMANFTTLRRELFPALLEAYQHYLQGDQGRALYEVLQRGAEHWLTQAEKALALYRAAEAEEKSPFDTLAALDPSLVY